jgi:hypothetical protein
MADLLVDGTSDLTIDLSDEPKILYLDRQDGWLARKLHSPCPALSSQAREDYRQDIEGDCYEIVQDSESDWPSCSLRPGGLQWKQPADASRRIA